MTLRNVFMFAGQGSQYHHMGSWLYENDEVYRATLLDLDQVVRSTRGDSVLERIYGADRRLDEPFDGFRDSQPGIFMVEYALARSLIAQGIRPDAVLGASLGEVAACAVAEALDPHEALTLLLRQVEVFTERCPRGGMLAVLAEPEFFERESALHGRCQLAAVNSPNNFVVAGTEHDLDRAEEFLTGKGVLFQRLPVPFAFHSSYIEAVREDFLALIGKLTLRRPRVPLLSATTGGEVPELSAEHIWQVMRRPFDVRPLVDRLLAEDRHLCLDLGPSGSMANLITPRLPAGAASRALPLMSPFSRDGALVEKVLAYRRPAEQPQPTPESAQMTAAPVLVHVFPGQGSQVKGMGKELFDRFPELTARADEILGYSIRTLCVEDPDRKLKQTEFTQPALYVVSALTHLAALQEGGRLPDYVLGHSLGEYVALFAAGVYDFETGLRLVRRRGELMSRADGGTMAAVAGDTDLVRKVLAQAGLDAIDIANLNSPSQTVIAGPKEAVDRALPLFTEAGARCVPLNVSAPFHSRYMAGAAEEFGGFLDGFVFAAPKIPVIANVDARPYGGADDVRTKLRRQIDSTVHWTDSVRFLMGQGPLQVRELGPGTVLTKLVAKIQAEAVPLPAEPSPATPATPVAAAAAPVAVPAPEVPVATVVPEAPALTGRTLGSAEFRAAYGVDYAYVAGGMHHGVTSVEFVARMAGAGFLSFLGTSGLTGGQLRDALEALRGRLGQAAPWGVNLTYSPFGARAENDVVDAALAAGVRFLEVSTYVQITPALVRYRLRGARVSDGRAQAPRRLLAKVTRPDVARLFFEPPPARIVERLLADGAITAEEAAAAALLPMADDVCAVGDAGGYTDMGVLPSLLPSVRRLRDEVARSFPRLAPVRLGAGGGIGAPEAAAAAFVLGADFVLIGSAHVCTVESGMSDRVKDMLQDLDVHDTTYAPFGDLFELGGRTRVLKKGVLFHARANKLYDLWRTHDDWQRIDAKVRAHIEERYFQAAFDDVLAELRRDAAPGEPEPDPKRRMALVFRWYCDRSLRLAVAGEAGREMDFQVACGPALGASNQWLREAGLGAWRSRHADDIGRRIMNEASAIVAGRRSSG